MPALRESHLIRAILQTDTSWSVYALGDLAPDQFHHCSWYRPSGDPAALALVYRGFTPPVLFALGPASSFSTLLYEFSHEPSFYLHVRPEIVPALAQGYRITTLKPMWRMVLDHARFPVTDPAAIRLRAADLDQLQRLYADGHAAGEAPDFFTASMLETGAFYAIRERDELVAAAGTHLVAPQEGVAAIGCVYTRRDRRGHGLASRVTSAVAAELLRSGVARIALNVNQHNTPAIRVYERLGFTRYCEYCEGLAERKG